MAFFINLLKPKQPKPQSDPAAFAVNPDPVKATKTALVGMLKVKERELEVERIALAGLNGDDEQVGKIYDAYRAVKDARAAMESAETEKDIFRARVSAEFGMVLTDEELSGDPAFAKKYSTFKKAERVFKAAEEALEAHKTNYATKVIPQLTQVREAIGNIDTVTDAEMRKNPKLYQDLLLKPDAVLQSILNK